ncbi:MAG: trypsin-like peptidase domain-containing protein [Ilumatobacteraceae bacterium]
MSEHRLTSGLGTSRTGVLAVCVVAVIAVAWSLTMPDSDRDGVLALRTAVRIEALGCSARPQLGVGNVVADGIVATVAHVVAGADSITATLSDGTVVAATVVAIDRETDVALLRIDTDVPPLGLGSPPESGDGTYAVWREGQPVTMEAYIVRRTGINAPTVDGDRKVERQGMQLRATVVNGDSGSIVVSGGRAVGVVFARSTDDDTRAWATDVVELRPLLDSLAADPAPVDVGACK